MIDTHKDVFWGQVANKELAKKIRWKPLILGTSSRMGFVVIRVPEETSAFTADYLQHKLGSNTTVTEIDNRVIIHFSPQDGIETRSIITDSTQFSNIDTTYRNCMGVTMSFLPKSENEMEKTLIIKAVPLCDNKAFFNTFQKVVSLYDRQFYVDLCHLQGPIATETKKGNNDSVLDLIRRFKKAEYQKGTIIVKANEVEKFMKLLLDKYNKGEIESTEELFIMRGKNFRLEANPDRTFELQGDITKFLKLLKKKAN